MLGNLRDVKLIKPKTPCELPNRLTASKNKRKTERKEPRGCTFGVITVQPVGVVKLTAGAWGSRGSGWCCGFGVLKNALYGADLQAGHIVWLLLCSGWWGSHYLRHAFCIAVYRRTVHTDAADSFLAAFGRAGTRASAAWRCAAVVAWTSGLRAFHLWTSADSRRRLGAGGRRWTLETWFALNRFRFVVLEKGFGLAEIYAGNVVWGDFGAGWWRTYDIEFVRVRWWRWWGFLHDFLLLFGRRFRLLGYRRSASFLQRINCKFRRDSSIKTNLHKKNFL